MRENRYLFVNRAYAARFGLTPSQVIGRTIPEVVGERAFAAFEQYTLQALAGQRMEFEVEIPYERIGVHFIALRVRARRRRDGTSPGLRRSDFGCVATAHTEQLREADRRKDEFLAMLGHELRNPLAPLGMAAEIMRTRSPYETVTWARDVMARQLGHLTRLVDDLLDVSRSRAARSG